ncbi:MAG: dTDP-glucose 4,6-dehydratase [Rickettsiales bacterium]|nr:dTDP-glucose 4,6-dehydratase [Rickettsiales bacterium]
MSESKNILVTGGAGFIGSCIVGQCVAKGNNVIVLDALTYAGHRENLEWIQNPSDKNGSYKLIVGNICNQALVSQILNEHNIDYVVNFAAESHVDNSIESSAEFITTNICGTHALLECSRVYWNSLPDEQKNSFRFLQISTDEVYGSLGEEGKFHEEYPIRPNSPYSASKSASDGLVRAWNRTYDLPTITTNCSNNYGPRQFTEKLIPKVITSALEGKTLPVYGDGKNIRDWIHVEDHCSGVYLALTKGTIGETYCFGGNAEKTNIDIVTLICERLQEIRPSQSLDYKSLIKYVADRPGHDRRYAIDDSKAQNELGFSRKYNFDEGINHTIDWYINNEQWCANIAGKQKAA